MEVTRIEPRSWFAGMRRRELQLLVHGQGLDVSGAETTLPVEEGSVRLLDTPDTGYQLVQLTLAQEAVPGTYEISLRSADGEIVTCPYELKPRPVRSGEQTITNADCVYLVMPDRFASDGDTLTRKGTDSWHGGNLNGLARRLGYIAGLGMTALWCTPVFRNQTRPTQGRYHAYHGYAVTDFYDTDPHFGTLSDYRQLVSEAHRHGLKVVKDIVFNHCSIEHPFVTRPPQPGWVNGTKPRHSCTNYKTTTVLDPYASRIDRRETVEGWFTGEMADLNLRHEGVLAYLTQMSLWWVETFGLDAIRMDTFLYSDLAAMKRWLRRMQEECPGLSIIAEAWMDNPAYTAATQRECLAENDALVVMDFTFQHHLTACLAAPTADAAGEMYWHFLSDILYPRPAQTLAFLDNHDLQRWAFRNADPQRMKQAIGLLLTAPRIPQVLYGTELALRGAGRKPGDGFFRQDFPWRQLVRDASGQSSCPFHPRPVDLRPAYLFLTQLLWWRRTSRAVTQGTMKHYLPRQGVYVYVRTFQTPDLTEKVIVFLNTSSSPCTLDLSPYAEDLSPYAEGIAPAGSPPAPYAAGTWRDVLTSAFHPIPPSLPLAASDIRVMEIIRLHTS